MRGTDSREKGEDIDLVAADGTILAAVRYRPEGAVKASLVVAGATGVPQGFYRRFALHAARRGFDVLTFDYRGVGRSAPSSLRGYQADFLDWGRLDLPAAARAMAEPGRSLFMIGHSYGGHGFGLMPDNEEIDAFWGFGVGSGWHGWMPRLEQLRVLALWHLIAPVIVRRSGFLGWSRIGMGEDLPLGIYRQWKRWCGFPHYFFDDPMMAGQLSTFEAVRAPVLLASATDDRWAPPCSRDAFLTGYRNARGERLDLDPRREGLKAIGHMGYFRSGSESLWDQALDWFESKRPL